MFHILPSRIIEESEVESEVSNAMSRAPSHAVLPGVQSPQNSSRAPSGKISKSRSKSKGRPGSAHPSLPLMDIDEAIFELENDVDDSASRKGPVGAPARPVSGLGRSASRSPFYGAPGGFGSDVGSVKAFQAAMKEAVSVAHAASKHGARLARASGSVRETGHVDPTILKGVGASASAGASASDGDGDEESLDSVYDAQVRPYLGPYLGPLFRPLI